jgi:zona occludens toxin
MPISIITGLPGNGKSLYAIGKVKAWAEKDSRPVFYSGIADLKLPWTEIDAQKWYECPPGAIVVIDECQRIFRNRSINSKDVPEHVVQLETHRHLGIDLVCITQHPMLIDPALRRLTDSHEHLVRVWGTEKSQIHKWSAVRDNCDKPAARKDSEKRLWNFDKSIFALYHSAELHTVKRTIPRRVIVLLMAPLIVAVALYGVWHFAFADKFAKKDQLTSGQKAALEGVGRAPGQAGAPGAVAPFDPIADARHYIQMNTPRVVGLPQTEPKYDKLTEPTHVPIPAMCIEFKGACNCKTQQATPMDVPDAMCRNFARNGFFHDFDADKDRSESERTAVAAKVMQGHDSVPPASQVDRQASFSMQEEQGATLAFSQPPDLPRVPTAGGHSKPADNAASGANASN